jgi:glycosyltransferase involved in cell wall biosynthesis
MRILALPRYTLPGASSRVRFFQYLPWLKQAGLEVEVRPLFADAYVAALQSQGGRARLIASAYASRLAALRRAPEFDLLWIEKELFPWLPADVEQRLLPSRVPYVLDYDDAVFHQYDEHRSSLVRRFLADKHPRLMRAAAMVVAGNDYLAGFARAAGACRVETVPSVVDLRNYPVASTPARRHDPASCVVGWVGQRSTASFLEPYADLFRRLAQTRNLRFAALGIDACALGLPMDSIPWSEQTEGAEIARFDIGIMPLPDQPFERGKCGYKIIQYMAAGVPVVASPVGVNRVLVEHGVNGFLADTPEEWEQALTSLASDAQLRHRMGTSGRRKVENAFCVQKTAPRLSALLREAGSTGSSNRESRAKICVE